MAAYYYLPRPDDAKSVHTERAEGGLLVDYSSDGSAIGIEITAPRELDFVQLNQLLSQLGHERANREDLAPLIAT